jgi:8-amino-7-oxononanoate synthase
MLSEEESNFSWLEQALEDRQQRLQLRHLREAEPLENGRIILDGKDCLNFCSNDYLGLMSKLKIDPSIAAGATASRLICGNHASLIQLEKALATLHQCEAALVFGNGYMANLACLSSLAGRGDAIYSDKLNHASIIDGARLSDAEHIRYPHNDLDELEKQLIKGNYRRRLIVSDAVFSMDGDRADIDRLVNLSHKYDAMLMLDEAHSGGVFGPNGAGLAAELGLSREIGIHMGTLSKAFGTYGAYVCGKQSLIDYLINFARPLIYSTALAPILTETAIQAVDLISEADNLRVKLAKNASYFREKMTSMGLDIGASTTQIVPLILNSESKVMALSKALFDNGIAALPIRPPTVTKNQSRIRFSLMASHSIDDFDYTLASLERTMPELERLD